MDKRSGIKVKSLEELKSFVKPVKSAIPNILSKSKSSTVVKKGTTLVGNTVVKLMKVDGLKEAIKPKSQPSVEANEVFNQFIIKKKPERKSLRIAKASPVKEKVVNLSYRPQLEVTDPMIKSGQSSKTIDEIKEAPIDVDMLPPRPTQQRKVFNLPLNVIAYISRLERENKELNKIVSSFHVESNCLAQSLFKLSQKANLFDSKKLQNQQRSEETQQQPGAVDEAIKFPITSIDGLSAIEFALSSNEFYMRVFKQLSTGISKRMDVKEENILFEVLSTMIDLKVFGLMDYDNDSSLVSLKMFTKFRDLFGLLVSNNPKCKKIYELKEIDKFLKIQIEEQKLILLSLKDES